MTPGTPVDAQAGVVTPPDWSEIDGHLLSAEWYASHPYHDAFKTLRDHDPVRWVEDPQYGKNYWAVTRYADVQSILNNPRQFSSRFGVRAPRVPKRFTPEVRYGLGFDSIPAFQDEPMHSVYRRPLNKHFSVPAANKLRDDVERYVDEII